jgi:hypothetical protein
MKRTLSNLPVLNRDEIIDALYADGFQKDAAIASLLLRQVELLEEIAARLRGDDMPTALKQAAGTLIGPY